MTLTERQEHILASIVETHIRSAEPVGSAALAGKRGLRVSAATLRNEMAALEESGYISQPHTSAGRVPSEEGYRYYIGHFLNGGDLRAKEQKAILEALKKTLRVQADLYRALAKTLSNFTPSAIIVAFSERDFYYTGFANLFSEPEFRDIDLVRDVSQVIDGLDEVMAKMYGEANEEISIVLGKENPFGRACGAMMTAVSAPEKNGRHAALCFLGPMRMDYQTNASLLRFTKQFIKDMPYGRR